MSLFSLKVSPMLGQNYSCAGVWGACQVFFPGTKDISGLSAFLEKHGAKYFKMAGTSPHRPTALLWLPRSISKAETDQGLRETIKKNNYTFNLNQNPVWVTRKRKANTVGLTGSTCEEPELRFYEWDHEYQMKAVCFCKDYPVSIFPIMTVMLLVHPEGSSPVFDTQQTLKQNPRPPTKSFTGGLHWAGSPLHFCSWTWLQS